MLCSHLLSHDRKFFGLNLSCKTLHANSTLFPPHLVLSTKNGANSANSSISNDHIFPTHSPFVWVFFSWISPKSHPARSQESIARMHRLLGFRIGDAVVPLVFRPGHQPLAPLVVVADQHVTVGVVGIAFTDTWSWVKLRENMGKTLGKHGENHGKVIRIETRWQDDWKLRGSDWYPNLDPCA